MLFVRAISIVVLFPVAVFAQADFTRQFLSSGHYEVRSAEGHDPGKKRGPASSGTNVVVQAGASANVATKVETAPAPAPTQTPAPAPSPAPSDGSALVLPPKPVPAPKAEEPEPGVVAQVKSLFVDENDDVIVRYEEKIHPDDPRLNRLEIEGRAGVSSVDSTSNYSFRRFSSSFGTVDLRSSVWMAPSFGLTGAIRFSLGASIRGDETTGSMDRVKDEELELGLRFRRFFGTSRTSPSLEFGVVYLDHSFNVFADSVSHPRWRSSGLGAAVRSRVPVTADRAWTFGGRIFPRLKHQETATSVDVSSGDSAENVRVDLEVGGDLAFGRGHQFVYGVQLGAERDLFDGSASKPDPETSATPSNVTVTNALVNFSFGYRWGR